MPVPERYLPGVEARRDPDGAVRTRRVSVLVPMLNEAENVERLVADLAGQDFDGEIETIVADGGSRDGSVERLLAAAERAGLEVTVIENPERLVPYALNACIARATGELLVRLDCKSHYPADYVRNSVRALEETDAWVVGPVVHPEGRSPTQRAIAAAMDSPFGGIHWTRHGSPGGRIPVDHVYCGAFRPSVFEKAGLFDGSMGPCHDGELSLRIHGLGGTVLLDSALRAHYFPVASLRELFGKYYDYGFWKVPLMVKHRRVQTLRSVVPAAFTCSLGLLAAATPASRTARRLLALQLGVYATGALAFGGETVRRRGESATLLPRVVAAFAVFHLAHGSGMLRGWVKMAARRRAL